MNQNIQDKKKVNINIFINNDPEWGGTFQYTQLIIKAIEKEISEKNIFYYFTKKEWSENLSGNCQFLNFNLFHLILLQLLIFMNLKSLFKLLCKVGLFKLPDSFFEKDKIWLFPSQDLISVLCGGKSVVSINDLMHRYCNFPETSSFFRRFYRDYKFKKISKKSYRVLVDSYLGKKHVEDSYGKFNNIRVQYFSAVNDKLKKNDNKSLEKYIIYPAQFWKHKNHTKLILAIKILTKKYKNIKLLLIGHKKRDYISVNKLVKSLDLEENIKFLGYVSDDEKANLLINARALVNPSFLGPTNIPQLEAFNYNCPVILSNVFASKEQCGDNVIYFDPEYEDTIAKAIEKIWVSDFMYDLYKNKSIEISKKFTLKNFSSKLVENIL